MAILRSLNSLRRVRSLVTEARRRWLIYGGRVEIAQSASLSLSSRFISRRLGAVSVGADTLVAFKTLILGYDAASGRHAPVQIGERCFIGGGSVILPGVTIGNEVIVGASSVVFDDVPDRCIVAGNPARIVRRDIVVGRFGRLMGADDNSRRLWKP
ncbi:MAG: DapH/DapD/GlmU-related protein [Sphingopyxis sp.]|uniref:DapH/DapD/GlmU-related protein n=1 Tax=Sphingopyxis sp. TaxID=1908224 RepID=UPI002ABB304C|nr:DapH/DapD/GlmU-related protein [Sphingopyxis sp.]MDZ3833688.1 DapH/DapD/GlmU-related protein [Sphingopyxis sp.]